MTPLAVQGAVLVLMLLALPLTSAETTTGTTWLSVLGLVAIAVGALVPTVRRFRTAGRDDGDDH